MIIECNGFFLGRKSSMSAQVENEVWQVIVQGVAYEADDIYTLKQWVAEGRVLPSDRVKKGNLSWVEAHRVPELRTIFAGEESYAAEVNNYGCADSENPEIEDEIENQIIFSL